MHDLAEQSRSPILNHQSHLCTHKHPPGRYNFPPPFPSHIILHFKEQQDCRRHEEEEEEVPMDYHQSHLHSLLALLPMLHVASNKQTKKQCIVVEEDAIHHSRNEWGWRKEGRKEGRRRRRHQRSERQTDLQLRTEQAPSSPSKRTFWEHRIPLVPHPNPKP